MALCHLGPDTTHTYNHGDMFLPLLQEVLQELRRAAQGQVLKCVCDPMPELQDIQPVPQPGQMDHFFVTESAEGMVDQICAGGRARVRLDISSVLKVSTSGILSFYFLLPNKNNTSFYLTAYYL